MGIYDTEIYPGVYILQNTMVVVVEGVLLLGEKNENWGCGGKNENEGKRKIEKNGLKKHL